jgi:hypothetical protein
MTQAIAEYLHTSHEGTALLNFFDGIKIFDMSNEFLWRAAWGEYALFLRR